MSWLFISNARIARKNMLKNHFPFVKMVFVVLILGTINTFAFPYLPLTGTFTPNNTTEYKDFRWTVQDYSDCQVTVSFNDTGFSNVLMRLAYPMGGLAYLTVYDGVLAVGATQIQYTATIDHTNLPPAGTYFVSFLAANLSGTNYTPTRVLAQGTMDIKWTPYSATNQAGWTNLSIISSIGSGSTLLQGMVYSNQMGSGLSWDGTQWDVTGTSIAEVAYGTATNTAYRGDWGAAVSNAANTALSTATGAAATADSAYTAATQAQATADAAATGTPVYVESDPVYIATTGTIWDAINSKGTGSVGSVAGLATGTPVYAESDPVWAGVSNATAVAINGKLGTSTWAAADSTTNYAERTIWGSVGITFGGIKRLSVEDNQLVGSWGVGELTVGTNLQVGGVVTGGFFVGDGSGLTNLPASGSGATQLLINVSGGAVSTSTISGAVLTISDMDSPAGADLSGLSNDVLSAWATASNALTTASAAWNATNYIAQSQIHIANLGTHTVTRASGAYIDLTNAAQAVNFDADTVSTAGKFGWALDYKGTNALSLIVTNTGAVVQPTAISLTNGAGIILFVKPQGSETIKAYQ
jgi:hypothetical protein